MMMELFPEEWNSVLYSIRSELFKKLSLSEDEKREVKFKAPGEIAIVDGKEVKVPEGQFAFDNIEKEIELTSGEMEIYRKKLSDLENQTKLNSRNVTLWLKFVKGNENVSGESVSK